ncbi:hypothetical protein BSK63_17375 [Paenibacillus odorifer]|uniref:stalk domain-containing protein n=1 Tax=Paenibacillus odorifer TaxID=189426 RepID=UPI00096FD855|nr:stalk domain-containing protein [Paenibacillus odorifer]OME30664.1 hypothetical protein BSK63_17375 [Paenibacillus odorifer]
MKKYIIGFICGSLFFSGVSFAADSFLKASISKSKVIIDGSQTTFTEPVVTINGRLYVPLREFTQETGYSLTVGDPIIIEKYNKLPQTLKKGDITITLNSLKKVNEESMLNITVKNENNISKKIEFTGTRADFNAKNRKYYTTGGQGFTFIPAGNFNIISKEFLDDYIEAAEEVTGDVKLGTLAKGTQNLLIHFKSGDGLSLFDFYVDTAGLI